MNQLLVEMALWRWALCGTVHLAMSFSMVILFSGCLGLNDISSISTDSFSRPTAKIGRAIVLYGIGVEGKWDYPRFATVLDEYNFEQRSITGNCWRFNRMQESVPAIIGTRQYFIFDVKPGHYVYSGFNGARLRDSGEVPTFEVPAGRIVYLGDFVYSNDGKVDIRRDLDRVQSYFKENVLLADMLLVPPPKLFLCSF